MRRFIIFPAFLCGIISFFIMSCANQLPPSGGPDDVTPPSIIRTLPSDQSLNFSRSSILVEFDDYVDRRSFQESFRIIPRPAGEISFDWSSRSVEVAFSKPLERNRTYVVTIGTGVKDLNGNTISQPVQFAFSTGSRIDEGRISGNVITGRPEKVVILAFLKNGRTDDELNPEDNRADYSSRINPDGSYSLSNLPEGGFRLFAITDENNNELYDRNFDTIAVTFSDPELTSADGTVPDINFLLSQYDIDVTSVKFLQSLRPRTGSFISTNYFNQSEPVSKDHRFYFYFRNNPFSKEEIIRGITLTDSVSLQGYRLVYNWINDSLLEAFSIEDLPPERALNMKIELTGHGTDYINEKSIMTAGVNDYSNIGGEIQMDTLLQEPVVITLINKNSFSKLTLSRNGAGTFRFENIPPGDYILYAFIDSNGNNMFDKGSYFPFIPSERFSIYSGELSAKARWNIEDVIIAF